MLSTAQDDVCSLVRFLVIELDQSTGECPEPAVVLTQNIQMFFSSRVLHLPPLLFHLLSTAAMEIRFLPTLRLFTCTGARRTRIWRSTSNYRAHVNSSTTLSCGQAANSRLIIDFDTFYASLQVTRLPLLLPQPKSTRIVGVTFYSVVRQSLTCRSIFAHL